jgi:hypothetical protein
MKLICAVRKSTPLFLLFILFIFNHPAAAQTDNPKPVQLFISCNKTTSLVFPQIIKSIDRGTRDLQVQKVNGIENILQLKAAKENFIETNLTVITADGKLYSFVVHYAAVPFPLTVQVDCSGLLYEKIAALKKSIKRVSDEKFDMTLRLKGLFIQNDIFYCQLELENASTISYDIDLLHFYLKDKRQSRRTSSQELEQAPLFVYGNTGSVPAQSKQIIVAAIAKFTIPDKKLFYIQVNENNGGRNLLLKISNHTILKARPL